MTVDVLALIIAAAFVVAGLIVALTTNDARRKADVAQPAATTLYDGTAAGAPPLVAHTIMLQGQPDNVTRTADGVVVTLLRKGLAPPVATPADVVQIAAEMIVVEESLGVKVSRGELRYQDRSLRIPFVPALRALALQRLADLRACDGRGPNLTRQDPIVCRACAYRAMCAIGRVNAPTPHSVLG
ncbi:MAG TPA: hypothetical protein VKB76_04995 [Ktedonobacterales bacterium]|nr:hypothetical protein [Ktedonobacterales bacterium]